MTASAQTLGDEVKRLVIARLDVLPSNMGIAIGGEGEYTPSELKTHVQDGDKVGTLYAEMQLAFIRSLTDGSLFQ